MATLAKRDDAVQLAGSVTGWNPQQVRLIKEQIAPKASDEELALFGQVCQRTGLDPFAKQIYAIHRWDGQAKKEKMTIQTSIDGYRLIADRTGRYGGSETFWCGSDGQWSDVWLSNAPPAAAKVVVYKSGCDLGFAGVAKWDSYVQTTKSGDPTSMWKRMPEVMLAKCAEAQALRKAFPAELSGIGVTEEQEAERHQTPNWDFRQSDLWFDIKTAFHNIQDPADIPRYEQKALEYVESGALPLNAKTSIAELVSRACQKMTDKAMPVEVVAETAPQPEPEKSF